MYEARVKADSRFSVVTACGGRTYVQTEWRYVPDFEAADAQANEYLDVHETVAPKLEVETVKAPVEPTTPETPAEPTTPEVPVEPAPEPVEAAPEPAPVETKPETETKPARRSRQ